MIRLASYNVENLFQRAKILNRNEWVAQGADVSRMAAARDILDAVGKLNALIAEPVYTPAIKNRILDTLDTLDLLTSDESSFVILRRNRGTLLRRPTDGSAPVVIADGRSDWIGWVELKTEAVNEIATQNTARVINAINADILAVVEAENRASLLRFNAQVLTPTTGNSYDHIMLIDGNDDRGIDVGLLCKPQLEIDFVRSHVDDPLTGGRRFSRDCPEFHLRLPSGEQLTVLVTHLKSKGYGLPTQSNAKRKAEAERVRQIYDTLITQGLTNIAVVGDFNDSPASDPLAPLLADGSTLRDISTHPTFVSDGRPGTYANGTASQKIDYILLSPALYGRVRGGAVFRDGVWGGTNGTLFPHLPEITNANQAASDHAAIYADLDL